MGRRAKLYRERRHRAAWRACLAHGRDAAPSHKRQTGRTGSITYKRRLTPPKNAPPQNSSSAGPAPTSAEAYAVRGGVLHDDESDD